MAIKIFDIFYADLSKNAVGSEQGGIRPVVVMQNDTGNLYSPTVIVIPVTSEIKKMNMPTHCILHRSPNGLKVDSMALAEQVKSIDKSRLVKKIGYLDDIKEQQAVVEAYMANVTGKSRYSSLWIKILDMLFKLIKEGVHNDAA